MLPFTGVFYWFRYDAGKFALRNVWIAPLIGLTIVVYAPYLNNPLVFDDFNIINGTSFLDHTYLFQFSPRWIPYATLAHTYLLADGSISAMRIGNLALHAANAIAVFVLLRELSLAVLERDVDATSQNFHSVAFAFLGAALFVVHPLTVYGVGYLIPRTILISTLFMLLMLIAYLRWLISGRTVLWIWSATWYLLSVLCKEHSVMAPTVALLLTPLLCRVSGALMRRLAAPFSVYLLIALLATVMTRGGLGRVYEPLAFEMIDAMAAANGQFSYGQSVVTQMYLYFKYLFLWIVPNTGWMSVDMREPLATTWRAWPYALTALLFLMYPIAAFVMVMRRGRMGIAGWILAVPWLLFATELSTVRVQEPFVLYRTYLWFPLLGAIVPLLAYRINTKVVVTLAVPLLCALMILSSNRLNTFSDALLLWEDAAKLLVTGSEPGAGRIYYNRALALAAKGRKEEALVDLDRAVLLHPKLGPIYFARAQIRFDLKRFPEAMQDLDVSILSDPNNSSLYTARAMTLQRLGHLDEARNEFRKSCDMKDVIGCYALNLTTKGSVAKP